MRCEQEIPIGDNDSIICNESGAHYCVHCERVLCSGCADTFDCESGHEHEFNDAEAAV